MKHYCDKCKQEYSQDVKECPVCKSQLREIFSEEEIQRLNDDFTIIDMFLM